jgi:hypothetical protein
LLDVMLKGKFHATTSCLFTQIAFLAPKDGRFPTVWM